MVFSFVFFMFSIVDVSSQAAVDAPNTYKPGNEDENDSIDKSYLNNNGANIFAEFNENQIDANGFYLRIDKLGLFKAIVPDVDPRYKEEYVASWEQGVSHGKFTSKPDKIGTTYLFSHAVSNINNAEAENAWFSTMDKLAEGDEVIVYYQGKKYTYAVSEIIVVNPDATGFYTGAAPVQKLRMQFCNPPIGSLAKRTLVDALLIDEVNFS